MSLSLKWLHRPLFRARLYLLCILLSWSVIAHGQTEGKLAPDFSLPESLLTSKSYELCSLEYLRVAHESPNLAALAMERAALCLQLAGEYQQAHSLLMSASLHNPGAELIEVLNFRKCMNRLLWPTADGEADCPAFTTTTPNLNDISHYVPVMAQLISIPDPGTVDLSKWQNSPSSTIATWAHEDSLRQQQWQKNKQKSPALAAALSALFPGMGRTYLGRWADGGITFILVATPAALSALSYQQSQQLTPLNMISLTAAAAMYVGNIYGSWLGAKAYNQDTYEEWRNDTIYNYRSRLDP